MDWECSDHQLVLTTLAGELALQHNGNTTGKAVAPFSGERSWSQFWSIDSKRTTLREYWWISVSLGLKRSSVVPKPFESSLWSAPGEKFYPAPQFTAQDFASHHMQFPFHLHGKPTFRLEVWYKATVLMKVKQGHTLSSSNVSGWKEGLDHK